jgi:hypothetical protein
LTTYQIRFKTAWKKLTQLPINGHAYNVDLVLFTCDCGRQKYKDHHLCKHLVQTVSEPDIWFWRHVIRYHKAPLYCHPHLLPSGYPEPTDSGSIADSDDHIWTGDIAMLSGGCWHVINTEQLIRKLMQDDDLSDLEKFKSPLKH